MWNRLDIEKINVGLQQTGKAIIAMGCSFVAGQGCLDDEIYENFKLTYPGPGYALTVERDKIIELKLKHPLLKVNYMGQIDGRKMEEKNAFVDILANKYLEGAYTPINFGQSGGANRGRVKELYLNPGINWDAMKEVIVIYWPTSIERFDFINDSSFLTSHFKTVWPNTTDNNKSTPMGKMWAAYGEAIYTEKFGVMEQIATVQELMTWCKLKNAKLIVTPAFDRRYNKADFHRIMRTEIVRDLDWNIIDLIEGSQDETLDPLIDLFPWENILVPGDLPEDRNTFIDYCLKQEPDIKDTNDHYFQFMNNRSPRGWITPCSHPGKKAHDAYAKFISEYIINSNV